MFRENTTLVIGAGASNEFSLPTGTELKDNIAQAVRFRFEPPFDRLIFGDAELFKVLHTNVAREHLNNYTIAGNKLSDSIPLFPSIDEALHYNSSDSAVIQLGKLAIVKSIMHAEKNSNLFRHGRNRLDSIEDLDHTWLSHFLSIAISASTKERAGDLFSNITFINFNYDRTIEHYLYWAMQLRAGIEPNAASEAVAKLKVIRPYGSLGPLDWQEPNGVRFGGPADLFQTAERIRTFTEQHESDLVTEIDSAINRSKLVIFLGFGYHKQNLSLFNPVAGNRKGNRDVFGTVLGIHEENHEMLSRSLVRQITKGRTPRLLPWKGVDLLSDLRPSISATVG